MRQYAEQHSINQFSKFAINGVKFKFSGFRRTLEFYYLCPQKTSVDKITTHCTLH